jgi:hypothetical protein
MLVGAVGIEFWSIIPKPLFFQCVTTSNHNSIRTNKDQSASFGGNPETCYPIHGCIWRAASMARSSRFGPLYLTGISSRPSELSFAGISSRPLIHLFCTRGFMRGERSIEAQRRNWTRRASKIYQRKLEHQKWSPKL